MKRADINGVKFDRLLVVVSVGKDKRNNILWDCICECGNRRVVRTSDLTSGKTKSCGCDIGDRISNGRSKNWYNNKFTPKEIKLLYDSYLKMKGRCYNVKRKDYERYGGRGIIVCDRWLESFDNYYEDMGNKPSPNHSVDRIDNNGNYEPSNCKWSTYAEQNRNRRDSFWVEHGGKRMVISDWAKLLGIDRGSIKARLKKGQTFDYIASHFIKKNNIQWNGIK